MIKIIPFIAELSPESKNKIFLMGIQSLKKYR